MQIALVLYDGLTALDIVGPYDVLNRVPGVDVRFAALEPGPVRTDERTLALVADHALADVPHPDVVVVPGGYGSRRALRDDRMLHWVRTAHETSRWTTSVCTGSLVLAAAGLLDGLDAATHWLAHDTLAELGARPTSERVVEHPDRRIMTAAGVSSGIDMALRLAARLTDTQTAQAIQLGIEYDPEPPFEAGSPHTAPQAVVDRLRAAHAERAASAQPPS